MNAKNILRLLLVAVTLLTGVNTASAGAWSITFDGKVSTDKTEVSISDAVLTVGGTTFGTASFGGAVTETSIAHTITDGWEKNLTAAASAFANAKEGDKIRFYGTIDNTSYWKLYISGGNNQWTQPYFTNWAGGDIMTNPSFYSDGYFEFTFGPTTASVFQRDGLFTSYQNITITDVQLISGSGSSLDSKFLLQTGTSWLLRTGQNNGLYSNNSGARSFALNNCEEGETITINSSIEPTPTSNATKVSSSGETHVFTVDADGPVTFRIDRYCLIHSIDIAAAPTKYTLTFYADGAYYSSTKLNAGDPITPPTRDGYVYSFWGTYDSTMPAKDYTVYGGWSAAYNLTLSFDSSKGSVTATKTTGIMTNEQITVTVTPLDGYEVQSVTFTNDTDNSTPSNWGNYTVQFGSGNITCTVVFRAIAAPTHSLTYKLDENTVYQTVTLEEGATIPGVSSPSKPGYTFTGWNPAIPQTMPASDMTVTAQFSINSYTLTYKVDGETYGTPQQVAYGTTITAVSAPDDREGYTFSGWQNVPSTMPAQDVVINGYFTKELSYTSISVGSTGYGTFCSGSAMRLTGNESVKAYIATAKSSTQATLTQVVGTVAAGTGLVLIGNANASARVEVVESGTTYSNNLLVGVLSSTQRINAANLYVLVNKSGVVKFADTAGNAASIPVGKAYLRTTGSSSRSLSIVFDDDSTTGIADANSEKTTNDDLYNLAGQRVRAAGKGLYIVNGKKVFVK